MADIIVEVHIPFPAQPDVESGEYPYPWIDDVEEYMEGLDGSRGEEYDSGEELGDEYLFFLAGAPEPQLLELAREIARLPRVPGGVYVTVNHPDGDMGEGRRVDLGV